MNTASQIINENDNKMITESENKI